MGNSIGADEDITNPSTFSYVLQNKCSSSFPPLQRCNFSGQSVFYASMSVKTNFKEIDKESSIGKEVYIYRNGTLMKMQICFALFLLRE